MSKTLSINLDKLGHKVQIHPLCVDSENAIIIDFIIPIPQNHLTSSPKLIKSSCEHPLH